MDSHKKYFGHSGRSTSFLTSFKIILKPVEFFTNCGQSQKIFRTPGTFWTFFWSSRSSRMSVKLVNIFVCLLQYSHSAWKSWIFFWSCKSFRMSVKLVNIFVSFVKDSWSAWRSQTFYGRCRSSTMSVKLVNIFVWLLQDCWSPWRS